ncbi:MAG: hypothetical protein WEC75_02340 [Dehalococcoidia bacterium]
MRRAPNDDRPLTDTGLLVGALQVTKPPEPPAIVGLPLPLDLYGFAQ